MRLQFTEWNIHYVIHILLYRINHNYEVLH